jgi:hypothetical protein
MTEEEIRADERKKFKEKIERSIGYISDSMTSAYTGYTGQWDILKRVKDAALSAVRNA